MNKYFKIIETIDRDNVGYNPLDKEVFEKVAAILKSCDDYTEDLDYENLLMSATFMESENFVKLLLNFRKGLDVDKEDELGFNLLTSSIIRNYIDIFLILLPYSKVDPLKKVKVFNNNSFLEQASKRSDLRYFNALLKHIGSSFNRDQDFLHFLIKTSGWKKEGRTELINEIKSMLLSLSVDINLKNNNGYTLLHTASYYSCNEIVEVIINNFKDIDMNLQDSNDGDTALHLASFFNNHEVVNTLLRHPKIDINITNNKGKKAIQMSNLEPEPGTIFYEIIIKTQNVFKNYIMQKECMDLTLVFFSRINIDDIGYNVIRCITSYLFEVDTLNTNQVPSSYDGKSFTAQPQTFDNRVTDLVYYSKKLLDINKSWAFTGSVLSGKEEHLNKDTLVLRQAHENYVHNSAVKIQSAYRGFKIRKGF